MYDAATTDNALNITERAATEEIIENLLVSA
jgi:hypothetical protein